MAITQTNLLREWAPLTDLFSKLPSKTQNGIFYQELKLTCVDVLPEFLALGTNAGIVYWYDRKKKDMQRLRCENPNIPITSLKIISTVDYMVACGNNIGSISIFQIPKSHPDSLPENLRPKNKQVERYTVTELHNGPISAFEWSKNGMKLFSGDKNGCVVLTEIDFYMHICKSVEILNEAYEVIQMSYKQQHLLISTTYRSIICQKSDKWKVCQVGKKDRKVLGTFGGIIFQQSYKPSDTCLYCTRPGLRIWISDIEGNVQKTLLFKDLLSKECPEVQIINPISRNLRLLQAKREPAFGILLPFNETLLVTYNNDVVYILDPKEMTILATISHLRGVLNIATYKDELYILEEERSLIRVSYRPEPTCSGELFTSAGNIFLPISTSLKGLSTKLQSTSIISAIPPILENHFNNDVNIHTDESIIMNAEEAKESPIKVRNVDPEIQRKFDEIGKQDFNDKILFKKIKHKKKSSMEMSTNSLSSNSSEEKDMSYTRPTLMNLSCVGVLPDLRSPQSIKHDIEHKERMLADVLSFDKVKIPLEDELKEMNNTPYDNYESDSIEKIKNIDISGPISGSGKEKNEQNHPVDKGNKLQSERGYSEFQPALPTPREFQLVSNTLSLKDTPECINIPNEWKLSSIELMESKSSAMSDNSLSDWEIV